MYKVIKAFYDLEDVKKTKSGDVYYEYNVGDEYPRKGKEPSEERIAELSGNNNKQGTPLIEFVEDEDDNVAENGNGQTDDPGSEPGKSDEQPGEEPVKAPAKKARGKAENK